MIGGLLVKKQIMKSNSIGRKLLLLISFIEGGAVMIIELLGAKIIAGEAHLGRKAFRN